MQLSVIFLSYNTRDLTEQALRSAFVALKNIESEVFVVDNASSDGSADMVEEKFPEVQLIRNEKNTGFSAGNNVALRQVRGNYVLLINTDTVVQSNAFCEMVDFMDTHPKAGAVGCKILNPDGSLQLDSRRGFPTPSAAFCKMSGLSRLFPNNTRIARYNMTFLNVDEEAEVDVLSGSCMLVRKAAIDQVGLLDEDYFMYGEDIDWCYRIRKAGWKIYYTPEAQIIHFRGESGRNVPLRILYRKSKAMSIFVAKHMKKRYRFFPVRLLNLAIATHGAIRFASNTVRAMALPLIDFSLALVGIKMGLAMRYHPSAIPLIDQIEQIARRSGMEVEPTRWLELPPYTDMQWLAVYIISAIVLVLTFWIIGLYGRRRFSPLWALLGVSVGFAVIMTLVFFFKGYNFSRLAAGAAWGWNLIFAAGWRLVVIWLGSNRGPLGIRERTILIGSDQQAHRFLSYWEQWGYRYSDLVGVCCESKEGITAISGRPILGDFSELHDLIRNLDIDTVVFVPGTLGLALEHLPSRWGKSNLRVCMVPLTRDEYSQKDVNAVSTRMPLVDIVP